MRSKSHGLNLFCSSGHLMHSFPHKQFATSYTPSFTTDQIDMWYFAGIPLVPANHAWFTAVMFFTCVAFIFVLMRVVSRGYIARKLGLDDFLMFLAMVSIQQQATPALRFPVHIPSGSERLNETFANITLSILSGSLDCLARVRR